MPENIPESGFEIVPEHAGGLDGLELRRSKRAFCYWEKKIISIRSELGDADIALHYKTNVFNK